MTGNDIFKTLPNPNLKISFGDDANMHIQFHAKNIPNKFQRWMLRKFMGIKMEIIKENI